MRKLVFWCFIPFIIVFLILTLVSSYSIDVLESFVGFTFRKIHMFENWAYFQKDKK